MADLMEEVQSILRAPAPRKLSEMQDPADEAKDLLDDSPKLAKMVQGKVDAANRAMAMAKQQAERLAKVGGGGALAALDLIGGAPKEAFADLRSFLDKVIEKIDQVVQMGKRGRGSLGYREAMQRRFMVLDAGIAAISEASPKPYIKPTADNDYSAELIAAATHAADFLSSTKQLDTGANVFIGNKSLVVVGPPKMVDQGCLVTLIDPTDENQPGDAYTLVLPYEFDPGTSPPPAMGSAQMTVEPTAEATLSRHGKTMNLRAFDIRLTEGEYGDNMDDYGDFGPGMGKINPGDRIAWLGGTELRVIGVDGSAAIVQPSAMDAETYGTFKAASQYSSVPVGQGVPVIPGATLWQPGMDPIPSNRDFPGRGGKDALDAHTTGTSGMLTNPDGHTSLVGARVLTYNPHSGKFSIASGKMPGDYEMADTIQVVGHDPAMPAAVGEGMDVRRFDLVLDEARGPTVIAKLRHVAESGHVMKVNDVLMDPTVASVIAQLHDAMSEQNRTRMEKMGVVEMLLVAGRMLKRLGGTKTEGRIDEAALKIGEPVVDQRATASLQGMKKLAAKNRGDINSALVSAAFYARKYNENMVVYAGNSYGHAVWRVVQESKRGEYTSAINNTGGKLASVTPNLELRWHEVVREKPKEEAGPKDKTLAERTYILKKKKRKHEGLSGALADALTGDEG